MAALIIKVRPPRPPRRPVVSVAAAAAATLLLVSGAVAQSPGAGAPGLPAPTGAAAIGRTELALTDPDRVDPFAGDGRARELAVWIWYPTTAGSTGPTAPFLPATWAQLANGAGVVSQDLATVATHAIADAPLAGKPPVVVLLPGLGQPVAAYTALAEDLASRGYAVVGINPTGSTSVVVFPDGEVVPGTAAGMIDPALLGDLSAWTAAAARITTAWVADTAFVVEALAAEPPAIGALDLSRRAYVGHSLGGAAAFQACADDPRCAAVVDLDGTLWTAVRETGLAAPALLFQAEAPAVCDAFCASAAAGFAAVAAAGSLDRAAIAGSRHMGFTDLGLLGVVPGTVDVGTIDPARMAAITRTLVGAFVDEHLGGRDAGAYAAAAAAIPELR